MAHRIIRRCVVRYHSRTWVLVRAAIRGEDHDEVYLESDGLERFVGLAGAPQIPAVIASLASAPDAEQVARQVWKTA